MKTQNWAISFRERFALALLSTTAAIVMSVSSAIAQTAEVNTQVNVRANPSPTAAIRATLPVGTRGTIIDRRGNWVYLVVGRVEGWVYAPYITEASSGGSSGDRQSATINASDVNVRSNPNSNAAIRATLPQGTGVTIIDRSGNWSYVVAGRVEGWVFSQYLTVNSGGSSGGQIAITNVADVNVRSQPDPYAAIRATLPQGTGVTITDRSGNWSYVVVAGGRGEGWVFSRYLTVGVGGDGTGGGLITPGSVP
ncbi:SH3 domain-containing protein [Microcoleus sp. FACHB-1515]|uniref:SH3 domain-containing protein n=1 Tax=Cyanophyceae TaxID=3028117 RepID=UPI001686BDD4|nr:SH3 domain-containing protein [Microcoleus sp. FACHB-1515]MBD2091562.1 SH3 domain-containing protein [Microcoleus sp. FACHB-1515]